MMNFGALKWFGSFIKKLKINKGRDSSVGKSSVSQAGDPGSNPSGGLTRVTQCMNEMGRD